MKLIRADNVLRLVSVVVIGLMVVGCQPQHQTKEDLSTEEAFSLVEPLDRSHLDVIVDRDDAIHLEQRAGIGAPKYRVERLIGMRRSEAINLVLEDLEKARAEENQLPSWVDQGSFVFLENRYKTCNISQGRRMISLESQWIENILLSDTPVHERLVLLFSNHFVADFETYRTAEAYARHHKIIRDHASGDMRSFLSAIIKDPAILIYLNNNNNFISNVNENFAREYLELFTLGEGNYTEEDIKNLAKVFAGESVNAISQEYEHLRVGSSASSHEVLGKKIKDPQDAVPLVLTQVAHAYYLADIFYKEFINFETVNEQSRDRIAAVYARSDFQISELLRATLEDKQFWDADNRFALVKDPVDLLLGTARTAGISDDTDLDFRDFLSAFSRLDFYLTKPPNVAGYPGGFSWIDGGLLERRIELLNNLFVVQRQPVDLQGLLDRKRVVDEKAQSRRENYQSELNKHLDVAPRDQLVIEAVFLHYVNRSFKQDPHPGFKLSLLGVHLGDKSWEGITLQMGREKRKGYDYVRIESNACFPSCFKSFAGGFSKKYGVKVIKYDPVRPSAGNRSVAQSLTSDERLLMKRLAQLVHFLPGTKVDGSGKFNDGGPENYQAWSEWLEKRKKQTSFDQIQSESGNQHDPVLILSEGSERISMCKAKYDNEIDRHWFRLEATVPDVLTPAYSRAWLDQTIPVGYQIDSLSGLEKVLASEAFQLK